MPRREATQEQRTLREDDFDVLPAALVELDAVGCVVRINRAACRLLGHPARDLTGTAFAALAPPTDRDALDAHLRALRRGHRRTTRFEASLEHADGRILRVRAAAAPVGPRRGADVLVVALDALTHDQAGDDASFRMLVEAAPTAIVSTDEQGIVVFVNAAAETLFGWSAGELVGRPVEVLVPERFRRGHRGLRTDYARAPEVRPMGHGAVLWALRKDGTEVPVEISLSAAATAGGMRFQTIAVDLTERLRTEAELSRRALQQAAIARLGERALEGAETGELMELAARLVADALHLDHVLVLARPRWRRGLEVRAVVGWDDEAVAAALADGHEALAAEALTADGPVVVPDVAEARDTIPGCGPLCDLGVGSAVSVSIGSRGAAFGVLTVYSPEPHASSSDDLHFLQGVTNVLADAIHRREVEERTRHAALHDPLTGLANRTLLLDRVRHWERSAERGARGLAAVLFMDLDDFKLVNDTLGHEAGDELLRQVGERLRAAVRPGDTVARFGGDEFVVFLEDLDHRDDVLHVVTRVQRAFAQPFVPGSSEHAITPSIGIALSDESTSAEGLVRNADAALYRAKAKGRARYELFDQELHRQMLRRLQLASELRRAVRRDDVAVHFEPVVELETGRVAGFEALARWRRTPDDRVGPGEFIPIAEETGLVVELGAAILLKAAQRAARWFERVGPAVAPYGVSVNLSPRQVAESGIVDVVRDVLARSGLEPALLALELTETALMSDVEGALATLERLRELGVRLVLDDFGTGYSSLSHLKRFPIDTVKVDKLFVDGVANDPGSRAIVAAVLSMATGFGAHVVAEGVETEEQRRHIAAVGCRYGQGHLFARDLTGGEAEALLVAQARRRAGAQPARRAL